MGQFYTGSYLAGKQSQNIKYRENQNIYHSHMLGLDTIKKIQGYVQGQNTCKRSRHQKGTYKSDNTGNHTGSHALSGCNDTRCYRPMPLYGM